MWPVAAVTWLLAVHAAVNARLLREPPPAPDAPPAAAPQPAVSVLVPARDEATRIGPCVAALLASRGVDMEVIVLDDGSTDGTADVAAAAAHGDDRLRVVRGALLPAGWLGKPHACAQLAELARHGILAFVDADVLVTRDGLARTVALLASGPLDLVSPYPRQMVDGPATRLVQPLLQWSWLTFLPLRLAERSPRPSLVAANGQILVCTAAAYRRAGGHAAVRDAVLEDLELARAFKRVGLRAGVVAGQDVAACAMYRTWDDLRAGYGKSLWAAFGSPAGAVAAMAALSTLYVLPTLWAAVAAARGDRRRALAGAAAVAGGTVNRWVTARRTGGLGIDAVWHPLSIVLLVRLTGSSLRDRAKGRLTWRGRPLATSDAG